MPSPRPWPAERKALLAVLWKEGLSASLIAQRLGRDVTRNAVIGQVHRLRLETRGSPIVRKEDVRTEVREASKALAAGAPVPRKPTVRKAVNHSFGAHKHPQPPTPPPVEDLTAVGVGVSLFDLAVHHCHWPTGPLLYCGQKTVASSSYCAEHGKRMRP
jgi:GcrA cell cycle regulator